MPYKNPQDRREQQKRYRSTEQGQEAHRRANAAYYARRRDESQPAVEWKPNPAPLTEIVTAWRT